MNAETLAEWLRRQGHTVVRTQSSYWYEQGPRVYQAFPFHWLIRPTDEELASLFGRQWALGLRYSTPADAPAGKLSYHLVREGAGYSLDSLGSHARRNVRHGLGNCSVEPIPLERLADEGWEALVDTCGRQGREVPLSRAAWRARCLAASSLPGFEAWGALVDGRLAASLLACQVEECCEFISQQCRREYLPLHVNNALCFEATRQVLSRPGVQSVFYTLQSLDAPASVDEFKLRMGFQVKPVRQRVAFHPWLAPLFNRASHALVSRLLARRPGNAALAKAEGMIRFYLEGRRAVAHQDLPEALRSPRVQPVAGTEPGAQG